MIDVGDYGCAINKWMKNKEKRNNKRFSIKKDEK